MNGYYTIKTDSKVPNPLTDKRLSPEFGKAISKANKGRIRINNGIETKAVFPEDALPYFLNGWVRGMLRSDSLKCNCCGKVIKGGLRNLCKH